MKLKYKNKKIEIYPKICNSFQKISGLMFTKRKNARALLFTFNSTKQPIHSYFVFFPFYAIWLDKNNKILEIKKVKPFAFHIKPKKPFSKLLEIPINNKYKKIINILESKA